MNDEFISIINKRGGNPDPQCEGIIIVPAHQHADYQIGEIPVYVRKYTC